MALGCGPGEMALWALEKAPLGAIFPDFFADFLQVFCEFSHQGANGRHWAANRADMEPEPCRLGLRLRPSPRERVVGLPSDLRPGSAAYKITKWQQMRRDGSPGGVAWGVVNHEETRLWITFPHLEKWQ
jgi:hypothetical protein